jgi:hypothetical protein
VGLRPGGECCRAGAAVRGVPISPLPVNGSTPF